MKSGKEVNDLLKKMSDGLGGLCSAIMGAACQCRLILVPHHQEQVLPCFSRCPNKDVGELVVAAALNVHDLGVSLAQSQSKKQPGHHLLTPRTTSADYGSVSSTIRGNRKVASRRGRRGRV